MSSVTILRQLWLRRRVLAGVAVVAVLAGLAVMYRLPSLQSRSYQVGIATGQIVLDTPDSQVVTLAPKGLATLGLRANVIASLMASGAFESTIAHQAGLNANQLTGVTDAATLGSVASGDSSPVSSDKASGRDAYILTTHTLSDLSNDPLPIIQFTAQGPSRAAAMRLANATISGLQTYLNTKAAAEQIPRAGRLQVSGTVVPDVTTESRGPTPLIAMLVGIFVFLLGCAAIVGLPILARGWRAAAALEVQNADVARHRRGGVRVRRIRDVSALAAQSSGSLSASSAIAPERVRRIRDVHQLAAQSPTVPPAPPAPAPDDEVERGPARNGTPGVVVVALAAYSFMRTTGKR